MLYIHVYNKAVNVMLHMSYQIEGYINKEVPVMLQYVCYITKKYVI